ncbi:inositol monophosphatase family protein [Lentzea sp. DG1S-22]|uniref:inositol monophosphatase family protein n=1 Tax=Lentzea sp. DG1S-22 TaxID=3108822 RepID=UPI002E77AFD3|nr:inositol monophosphatase family protein [Lentzea sp. DG1S-22]WVH78204.1 inositol monophosphatase family protein [Lentzea sp. DG1S-22]
MTPGALLSLAVQSCVDAAKLLHGLTVDVAAKGAFDQVSNADLEVEAFLRRSLTDGAPGSAVVGEELGSSSAPVTWFVDPIDGTRNFVRGIPLSCISVAAAVDGTLVAGCVLDPFRDELFTAAVDVPFAVRSSGLVITPGVSPRPLVLTDIPLPGSPYSGEMDLLSSLLTVADVRRVYSTALSLAWVAAGRADAAANIGTHPWDVAAGTVLVRAAGGQFREISANAFVAGRGEIVDWLAPRVEGIVS